jgi:hypothetical protein
LIAVTFSSLWCIVFNPNYNVGATTFEGRSYRWGSRLHFSDDGARRWRISRIHFDGCVVDCFSRHFDERCPSLAITLSFRWAVPIAGGYRAFILMDTLLMIFPVIFDGRCPSLANIAPSALHVLIVSLWAITCLHRAKSYEN